jgi:hypothetical protein
MSAKLNMIAFEGTLKIKLVYMMSEIKKTTFSQSFSLLNPK